MTVMESVIEDANAFMMRARGVTLDSLLAEAPEVAKDFHGFDARVQAGKGYWISMNRWDKLSKQELLELARERDRSVRASDSKSDLLDQVVASFWNGLDAAKAHKQASEENDRIRQWAKRLQEVPELLQGLVREAEKFYAETWVPSQSKGLHESASQARWHIERLLELEWAASRARQALRSLEANGRPLADIVLNLASDVQQAVMGVISTNLSASGTGLDHVAPIGGAKLLTRTYYRAIPEQAKPFVSTVYS